MRLATLVGTWGTVIAMAACSASGGNSTPHGSSGGSAGSAAGGGSSGSSSGGTGAGGSAGSGTGGQMALGGSGGSGASGGDGGACKSVPEETKPAGLQPADIIWAIDTSCSMTEEDPSVQDNMNAFSQQIVQSGIDVHVILIASYPGLFNGGLGICMQPPLGATGGCPSTKAGSDNNLPTFFHDPNPPLGVQSTNGLNAIKNTYPHYAPLLRAGATHWVVAVTDDDASDPPYGTLSPSAGADKFIADYKALDPKLADFKMSGITALSMCPNAANIGVHWQAVIQKTGGLSADICNCAPGQTQACQTAFQGIFTQLAQKIIQASQPLDCQWPIPAPPPGQTLDPQKVNVQFTDNSTGKTTMLYHVKDKGACDPQKGGWYYDSDQNPTQVISCPESCTMIKAATDAKIDVLFGCATQAPPVQ